jgi:predicted component of viral defense system (DUF524 family)
MKIDLHEAIFKMNGDELSSIIETVKLRRNQLHFSDAQSLRVGDKVSFDGRRGVVEKAVVEKIKIKNVLVRTTSGTRWNVPGSHLTKIGEVVNA